MRRFLPVIFCSFSFENLKPEDFTYQLPLPVQPLGPTFDFPKIGRRVSEAEGRENVRELIYQGYRIIYLTRPERVFILTIVHGSRDVATKEVKSWDGL